MAEEILKFLPSRLSHYLIISELATYLIRHIGLDSTGRHHAPQLPPLLVLLDWCSCPTRPRLSNAERSFESKPKHLQRCRWQL
ncbi:hypothetical protein CI238_12665 [Colletotrichum incanum]|uniref:Uncharacterized protein n=1 Tax=Colletotrichum incanum TaxID=1573173 RepID=A0A161XWQ1_COLIC|nr:hypothetical protein CI238_12665 [Colletotrichum incanum]